MALRGIQLGLRVWEFLWTILVMALIGNMIAEAFSGNPAAVNYAMFTAAFSLFSLIYLFPASWNLDWAGHPFIMIVVDALNLIFFLAAGIALAAKLHVHSCGNNAYTSRNSITNGSHDPEKRCTEAQASTAFLWFGWAGYTASFVISIFMARSTTANLRPRVGKGLGGRRPNMSQV